MCAHLPTYDYFLLGYQYLSDPLSYTFKIVLTLFLILIVYVSLGYFFHERVFFLEYFFFVGFFLFSAFFFDLGKRFFNVLCGCRTSSINFVYFSCVETL